MAEEMRGDGTVYLMGEEVGEYQGAYKISHRITSYNVCYTKLLRVQGE